MFLFMEVYVDWMTLMKSQNVEKFRSFIFLTIWQTIMFNGFKMSNFSCRSHMQKIILLKKHVWLSIEIHFGIF
jgi:hypothetical protein